MRDKRDSFLTNVGIDKIGFYTPKYYLDLATLAKARGVAPEKYYQGLGQFKMSIVPPDEDAVTMGVNAASELLTHEDKSQIDTLLFATESGVDQSKAAGLYVHRLLELPAKCRVVEIKQACYSATAALQMAASMVRTHPERKVLIVASDVARYGFKTTGESSQGAAAIAMLVCANPALCVLDDDSAYMTVETMDFWRPNYQDVPIVDGRYSITVYLDLLKTTWRQYCEQNGRGFYDHVQFCYHNAVPRLVEKAHKVLVDLSEVKLDSKTLRHYVEPSLLYCRTLGNCYAAALYVGLISMLENYAGDLSNKRVGLYSYGSGSVAEYFSVQVADKYQRQLSTHKHLDMIESRQELSQAQYEDFYGFCTPTDGSLCMIPRHETGLFRLAQIKDHQRIYQPA